MSYHAYYRLTAFKMFLLGFVLMAWLVSMPWKLMALAAEVAVVPHSLMQETATGASGYWPALQLKVQLESKGWTVAFLPIRDNNLLGVTIYKEHTIVIDSDLGWDDRYTTMVHEAAHTVEPYWYDAKQSEVFAESVAALLDPKGLREHARYLATDRGAFFLTVLSEWPHIYAAANLLR